MPLTRIKNLKDTGTEGSKIASGTTAQRGSTTGQMRFNTTTNVAEYYDGTEFKIIETPPSITGVDTSLIDSNSGSTSSIVITGSFFASGATVVFIPSSGSNVNANSVTFTNSGSLTAVVTDSNFVNANEPYSVKVTNPSGASSTLDNAINVDTTVAWSTSAGSLGSVNDDATGTHFTVSATDADGDTITYSVQSGSLPSGMSLNSSTGAISGDPTNVSNATTSNFTLRAGTTSANADRAFSIIVNPTPYNIDYLVVAGGGSGGGSHRSGGGGAGGYRNSYNSETSGRNSTSETAITITGGTVLTITVGAGGSMPTSGNQGNAGSVSSIAGSGLTTITSNGGGGGGTYESNAPSGTFGSGAGAGQDSNNNRTGSDGTAGQGFDGGDTAGGNGQQQGGCGGGASENGAGGGTTSSASGGNGLSSSITGSAVTRAGGGGGGAYGSGGKGFGGDGGGGQGGWKDLTHGAGVWVTGLTGSYSYPQSGTANTGGGGGGQSGDESYGSSYGSGGSGVVILRLPTARYSSTTSGSPTVTTSGSDTILTFNASGSYTA